jgi:alkanesulfonate monooxygenase SsuD/methylene tetrahydromethanopterin reductase-like flavin-dependent oxidoreductase (luciferase family)
MSQKIRFGYFYDLRNPAQWRRPWADFYAETLEFIAWTESVGFGGAWFAEHHGADDGYIPSPLVMAAAVAARTKRLRIGTAIAIAPLYQPIRLAEDCAIIDILSNGRLDLALALGYRRAELASFGLKYSERAALTDELLQIIRRLWDGETVTFHGKHFTIETAKISPRPIQSPMPLFIGGYSDKAVRRAARYGTGYIGHVHMYPKYAEAVRACGKGPNQTRFGTMEPFLIVSNDPEKTLHEIAPYALHTLNTYSAWMAEEQRSFTTEIQSTYRAMDLPTFEATQAGIVLTPEQAIAHIQAQRAAGPIESYLTAPPAGYPLSKFAEHAQLFADKVIPAFAED